MDLSVVVQTSAKAAALRLGALEVAYEVCEVADLAIPTLKRARGDYVLTLDAQLTPDDLQRMWSKRHEAELVIGSRFVRGPRFSPSPSLIANCLYGRTLEMPIADLTSGRRLYRRSALRSVPDGVSGAPEIAVRLYNEGYRLKEVALEKGSPKRGAWPHLLALGRLRRLRRSKDAADAEDRTSDTARQETIVRYLEVDVPVLDVGCGSSRLVQALSKAVGLDRRLAPLRYLRHRAPLPETRKASLFVTEVGRRPSASTFRIPTSVS